MKLKTLLIFLAPLFLLFSSCQKAKNLSKPQILVSIPAYQGIVQELVGDHAEVISVVPEGFNAHYFEVKPNDLNQIQNPIAWFGIQEAFEKKLMSSLSPRFPALEYYNLVEEIHFKPISGEHHHDGDHHHHHDEIDNHIWLSPDLMEQQMIFIAGKLQNKIAYVKEKIIEIAAQLRALDETLKRETAPFKDQALLASHGSFGYFCRDYHLVQIPIEVDGKQPLPKDMEELLKRLEKTQVICVLAQKQFDSKAAEYLAEKLSRPLYRIDPYSKSYFETLYLLGQEINNSR